jgi:hypothetical protein
MYCCTDLDDDDCSKNTCDTKWGFIAFKPGYVMKDGKNQCLCTPFYKKGSPCFDLTCPDKLLIFENKTTNKCECINPCSNVMCEAPAAPMIDYLRCAALLECSCRSDTVDRGGVSCCCTGRESEGLCKCVVVTDKAHGYHEEL